MNSTLDGKIILITGGTGSFGQHFVRRLLERCKPRKLIVFSRGEHHQFEMAQRFSDVEYPCMRYFIGDVRDPERLHEAFRDVDYVIHAAALKQVPAIEYNPFEAVKTNILGAQNIISAAIARGVKKIIALSTDKAATPINLYGATKLCADKLFVAGNSMSGDGVTRFSVVRYGNVFGSNGSVVPYFLKRREEGVLTVTDEKMTRFSITLDEGANFVLQCLQRMHGGEVFVPKIPSYRILDVAAAVAPEAEIRVIGPRPGEKLHEVMVPPDESRQTLEFDDHYVIQPMFTWWARERGLQLTGGRPCPDGFSYRSDTNPDWLSTEQLRAMVEEYCREHCLA